jgi:endonuclease/exonuclease/phosphatase (EEP) superfamily protein YafD
MAAHRSIETGTGRKLSSALLFLIGTAATLGTVAGFFGAFWWGFDRLSDWRFPYFIVLLMVAIVYGFVFRRALSAVFLLAAFVNAALLAPMWLSSQATAGSNDRIRVVSLDTSGSGDHRSQIIDWIDAEEVDVALLFRTRGDWAAALTDSEAPYRVVPVPVSEDSYGTPLVLVRHTATASPLPPTPGADLTVNVGNGTVALTLIGIAVPAPGSASEADRRIERFTAINAAARATEGPVVVTGNLETSRWSHAFGLISEGIINSEDGFGYAATWPSYDWPVIGGYAGLPLDHALYLGAITVPYRLVGPDLGPAHRPLLFDISPSDR